MPRLNKVQLEVLLAVAQNDPSGAWRTARECHRARGIRPAVRDRAASLTVSTLERRGLMIEEEPDQCRLTDARKVMLAEHQAASPRPTKTTAV